MKYLRLLIISFLLSNSAFAESNFSKTQINNLQKAYNYGHSKPLKYNSGSRVDFGYIMAAIVWQESSAGENCGSGTHSVGHYQNLITTVQSRMRQNGINKSRSQIAKELKNPSESAYWARIELDWWLKTHNGNISKALASYNAGYATSKGMGYSKSVLRKAEYLKTNDILKDK